MKTLKLLAIFINILLCLGDLQAESTLADPKDIKNCDHWSKSDWDTYIYDDLLSKFKIEYSASSIYEKTEEIKIKCAESIKKLNISNCLKRISAYYKQFSPKGGGGMFSGIQSDEEYYANQPKERMELPIEFRDASTGLPQSWKEVAKINKWKWALFPSNTGGQSRMVIVIPKNGYTQILVYHTQGINKDPTTYGNIQMQSIEFERAGVKLPAPIVNFRSWENYNGANSKPTVTGSRCTSCHTTGPRKIVPKSNTDFPVELSPNTTLEELNAMIVLKEKPDYSSIYDLNNFPTKLYVGGTECSYCHAAEGSRNSLAYSVREDGSPVVGIVSARKVINEKTMPKYPSEHLTDKDRKKMVSEIFDNYEKQLKAWLTETKCNSPSAASSEKQKENPVNGAR